MTPRRKKPDANDPEVQLEAIILSAREDPRLFADLMLASLDKVVRPHISHWIMQRFLFHHIKVKRNVLIQAPAEHGKTTQLIPSMLWLLGQNPRRKIGFVSRDIDLVEEHLSKARKMLMSKTCNAVWPALVPDSKRSALGHGEWSKTKLYLRGEPDPAFEVFALLGHNEGHRLDFLWIDDGVTRECLTSSLERKRVNSAIFDTFDNRLTDDGVMVMTCNCWHKHDAAHLCMDSTSWATLRIGYEDTSQMFFDTKNADPNWAPRLKTTEKDGFQRGHMPLWSQWSTDRLIRKKNSPGDTWSRMFELRTTDPLESLWRRSDLSDSRVASTPPLAEIVIAIDPSISSKETSDETGIIAAGLGEDGHIYILEDCSLKGKPDEWANAAKHAYHRLQADSVIYESNIGGDMVATTLAVADPLMPTSGVHASRGKRIRAEPVSFLSARGILHLVGHFPDLENELCTWVTGQDSPNRLDAMVYAVLALLGTEGSEEVVEDNYPSEYTISDWDD